MTAEQQSGAIEALLAGYAAGTLAPPLAALVGAHLELAPDNRGFVADLESLAGHAVETAEPVALTRRDERLVAIFAAPAETAPPWPPPAAAGPEPGHLPPSLRRHIGFDLADIPMRTLMPGFKEWRAQDASGLTSRFIWLRGGVAVPPHSHHGTEVTLVLSGSFSDSFGRHRPGDITIADEEIDHQPRADEDCLCFAVTDAPLRLTGPIGRLFTRFLRL